MASKRRHSGTESLQRRVRPRREGSELASEASVSPADDGEPETDVEGSMANASDLEHMSSAASVVQDEVPVNDFRSVSFGSLAKAQDSLLTRSRSEPRDQRNASEKLQRIRHRLQEIKDTKGLSSNSPTTGTISGQTHSAHDTSRSSKHAPMEMSSKRAVPRRREVLSLPKREIRDPRFDSLSGPVDQERLRKDYSFLDDYRENEMKHLRSAIKSSKDESAKEDLSKELLSRSSKKKAQEIKDKQQEVIRRHRASERELVQKGKKPYYLKKGEQKKLALVERYSGLKGKQVDRAIERRRKKVTARDRKNMPSVRRTFTT
ncbi:MAG: rRNA biogenesis protein rrp36 [Piccolia ochrophora]|nr:MAG: rRNA biogenesis protein rrp36 [Piccolia ochrophora]